MKSMKRHGKLETKSRKRPQRNLMMPVQGRVGSYPSPAFLDKLNMLNIEIMMESLVVVALIAVPTLFAATSQSGPGNILKGAGPSFNPVMRREIDTFAVKLGLDEEHRNSALKLYKGYWEATRHLIDQTNQDIDRAKSNNEPQHWTGTDPKRVLAFLDSADKLDESFFGDLRATLRPEQAAKFESILRCHRRIVGTRCVVMAGEGMDLVAMADRLKIRTSDGALSEALLEYENAMDPLMRSKSELGRGYIRIMANASSVDGIPDEQIMKANATDLFTQLVRVRDTNRSHARMIGSLLNDSDRAAWEKEVLAESFPRIYKQSAFRTSLAAAMKDASLNAEQKAEIATIAEHYELDVAQINSRWAAAIDEKQDALVGKGNAPLIRYSEVLKDDDALVVARMRRIKCDRDAIAKLNVALDESQRAKLPGESEFMTSDVVEDFYPVTENNDSTFAELYSAADELAALER